MSDKQKYQTRNWLKLLLTIFLAGIGFIFLIIIFVVIFQVKALNFSHKINSKNTQLDSELRKINYHDVSRCGLPELNDSKKIAHFEHNLTRIFFKNVDVSNGLLMSLQRLKSDTNATCKNYPKAEVNTSICSVSLAGVYGYKKFSFTGFHMAYAMFYQNNFEYSLNSVDEKVVSVSGRLTCREEYRVDPKQYEKYKLIKKIGE